MLGFLPNFDDGLQFIKEARVDNGVPSRAISTRIFHWIEMVDPEKVQLLLDSALTN